MVTYNFEPYFTQLFEPTSPTSNQFLLAAPDLLDGWADKGSKELRGDTIAHVAQAQGT